MTAGRTILIAESRSFAPEARRILSEVGIVHLADLDRSGLESQIRGADILWVRLRHRITAGLLELAPRLRAIASPTTGLNHIDLEAAARRGIKVLSLQGEFDFLKDIRATAEHTLALTLGLLRHVPQSVRDVRRGNWERDRFRGSELFGKTVGVIGYGRLGRIVAGYYLAFGARVLVCDPAAEPNSIPDSLQLLPLETVLERADLVTLHVNLTAANTGFFRSRQFAQMKPGAYLVNTSRGELIDDEALLTALRSRRLAGAALDVISGEHDPGKSPLIEYSRHNDNLLITPHVGGCTRESMEKTEVFLANRVSQWLRQLEYKPAEQAAFHHEAV